MILHLLYLEESSLVPSESASSSDCDALLDSASESDVLLDSASDSDVLLDSSTDSDITTLGKPTESADFVVGVPMRYPCRSAEETFTGNNR